MSILDYNVKNINHVFIRYPFAVDSYTPLTAFKHSAYKNNQIIENILARRYQ